MPGLFGFPSLIERAAQVPAQGAGAAFAQAGLAAGQSLRDAGARQSVQQQAIERLSRLGTPESQQVAQLISTNPRAAQQMVEQFGGFAAFEQRELQKATYNQAVQRAMQPGATPQDILSATLGGDPDTGLAVAGMSAQMQPAATRWLEQTLYDPSSPTLSSEYRVSPVTGEQQWLGYSPPKQQNGMEISYDEQGRPIVRTGGLAGMGAAGSEPTKPTLNKLQDDLIASGDQFARLTDITRGFDRDFLTYKGQATAWGLQQARKLGMAISPEQQDFLSRYADFKSSTLSNVNRTIKEITGAAMTQGEAERILGELPNMDDDDVSFESKMTRVFRQLNSFRDRRLHMLAFGITDVREFSESKFKRDRDQRIEAFTRQAKQADPNLSDDEAEQIGVDQYVMATEGAAR